MEKLKAEAIHRELNLIAKELMASEKIEFKDLEWRDQSLAIRKARKEAGLPEEPHMTDDVSVYSDIAEFFKQKDYDIEIGINWKALGTKGLAETKKFADALDDAMKKAKKLGDVLKKNFPGIKLKGI